MELKLPMVVVHKSQRLVEAWLPHWPHVRGSGPSLSALRDDLALRVMEQFEQKEVPALGASQLPPIVGIQLIRGAPVAGDRKKGLSTPLVGRIGVLVEKWPHDAFWTPPPTRLSNARFACR